MTAAQSQRGRAREVKVVDGLILDGWQAFRCASGPVDVVAFSTPYSRHPVFGSVALDTMPLSRLFVQVKSTAGGPYEKFRQKDRIAFLAAADQARAGAWLAWWPPHARAATWILSSDWPPVKRVKNSLDPKWYAETGAVVLPTEPGRGIDPVAHMSPDEMARWDRAD